VEIEMLRIKTASTESIVAATLMALLTGMAIAEDRVDARAEKVCTRIAQAGARFQGAFNVDDLNIRGDANGTVMLARGGVKLGQIGRTSYADHLVCLVEVMALISPKT
jgi:hypothetical protein